MAEAVETRVTRLEEQSKTMFSSLLRIEDGQRLMFWMILSALGLLTLSLLGFVLTITAGKVL